MFVLNADFGVIYFPSSVPMLKGKAQDLRISKQHIK